jgi:hypothetical protein
VRQGFVPLEEEFARWQREVNDRLSSLERGSAHAGRVSFDRTIVIGDAEITVEPGGGPTSIRVTLRNLLTGTIVGIAEVD